MSERSLRRPRFFAPLFAIPAVLSGFLMLVGCERDSASTQRDGSGDADERDVTTPARHWQSSNTGAFLIAVRDEAIMTELEEASRQARESAEEARLRWTDAVLSERRSQWMVKWSAPVSWRDESGETVEHVWMRPVEWSPFRIEGVLLSSPRADIGAIEGELVSFPVEQVSDWVHIAEVNGAQTREGGFTLEVLEKHFGMPIEENE